MTRAIVCLGLMFLLSGSVTGQSPAVDPAFEIADVHVSPQDPHHVYGGDAPVGGRFEIHSATMLELIRYAWRFDDDKILGGPSWLELDRFDVIAKLSANQPPANATPAGEIPQEPPYLRMLQSLLADRFKLVIRKETRPFPGYILTTSRKPLLKAADGSGDTGCRIRNAASFVPGSELQYSCRNVSMEALASILTNILGTQLGGNPVLDRTRLKGIWNIDFTWQIPVTACLKCDQSADDRAQFLDSVEKELGLKLELQAVPTPVLLVDSVNRKPTDNPPGVRDALPVTPAPTEFDVAVIKPTAPDFTGQRASIQPGGRVTMQGITLDDLLTLAVGSSFGIPYRQWIVGIPDWARSERFDITAIAPGATSQAFRDNTLQPMLRSLLEQRFGLKTHKEERDLSAYTLLAVKPKMKKADPASRSHCLNTPAPQGAPVGTVVLTCQNIAMDEFADRYVRNFGTVFGTVFAWPPVLDATGLQGGWDFTLTYVQPSPMQSGGGRGGDAPSAETPTAADPGGGLTVTDAVEKQLGLKLEMRKRPMPVTVIDHLERKPTDN